MSELRVSIVDQSGRVDQAITSGEVFDDQRVLVRQFPLIVGQTASVEVAPGHYLVRVTLPSSVTVTRDADVTGRTTDVVLTTQDSPHEWLAWQLFSAGLTPPTTAQEKALGFGPHFKGTVESQRHRPVVWHRIWRCADSIWRPVPWPKSWADSDGESWKYSFESQGPYLMAVEVGGADAAWRQTMLPPTKRIELVIRPSGGEQIFERGIQLAVESSDRSSEAVLRYMHVGSLQAARVVGDQLISQAESMLRGKLDNPFGAAVGGYYLLRARAFDQLHDWPNNFANWFAWLPDSAVIHAWQLLERGDGDSLTLARKRLLQAVGAGLPVVTEGLRLLAEGLRRVTHLAGDDGEMRDAAARITRYTDATDWTQPFTTFYGTDPLTPDIGSRTGVPLDWDVLEFLPEGEEGWFEGSFPYRAEVQSARIRTTFRVSPYGSRWEAAAKDAPDFKVKSFPRRARALEHAREMAQKQVPSRIIVYRPEGSIEAVQYFDR
jgi:hypothetical protein